MMSGTEDCLSPYPYDTNFHDPEPCFFPVGGEGANGEVLSQEQVDRFLQQGYLFLQGVWPERVIEQAVADVDRCFPKSNGDVSKALEFKALPPLGPPGFASECLTGWRGRTPLFPAPVRAARPRARGQMLTRQLTLRAG